MNQRLAVHSYNLEAHCPQKMSPKGWPGEKQNRKEMANDYECCSDRLSRYPEIETKIERLLLKIDSLVIENIKLKQMLDNQKQIRIKQEEQYRIEVATYQKHQQQIQEFVSQLQAKLLNATHIKQTQSVEISCSNNQSWNVRKREQLTNKDKELGLKNQQQMKKMVQELERKTQLLNQNSIILQQYDQRIKAFNIQVEQLKALIQDVDSINQDLVARNQCLQRTIEGNSTKRSSQSKVPTDLVGGKEDVKRLQGEIESKHQEIQDLLVGIDRLEAKLEASFTFNRLLQRQNSSLKQRTKLLCN